jgi:hypothetical protein
MFYRSPAFLMKAAFGVIALIAVGAVDFTSRRAQHGPGFGVLAYVDDLAGLAGVDLGLGERDPRLAALAPAAPAGWSVVSFEPNHLAMVMGRPPMPVEDPNAGTILALAPPSLQGGVATELRTYRTGANGPDVLLALRHRSGVAVRRIGEAQVDAALARDAGGFEFTRVGGLAFAETRNPVYDGARRFSAHIGRQIDIELVADADDATILAVLEGLDIAGLNATTDAPIPGLGEAGYNPDAAPPEADPAAIAEAAPSGFGAWFGGGKGDKPKTFTASCASKKGFKRCSVGD